MDTEQFRLHAELEERHWWFRARRHILSELVRRILPAKAGGSVVDIGCGTGAKIAALAADYHCLGLDISAVAIQLAKARFSGVKFICGSIPMELGHLTGKPRLFLLLDVLEHVPDDTAFLTHLVPMLAPGDHLLLTVPADMSLWSAHDVNYGHYLRYDIPRFKKAWTGLPVENLLLSYFNARLYPLVKGARILSHWRRRPWGEAGTDLRMPPLPINRLLEKTFAAEIRVLVDLLEGRRVRGYTAGVSLIALLRREGLPSIKTAGF